MCVRVLFHKCYYKLFYFTDVIIDFSGHAFRINTSGITNIFITKGNMWDTVYGKEVSALRTKNISNSWTNFPSKFLVENDFECILDHLRRYFWIFCWSNGYAQNMNFYQHAGKWILFKSSWNCLKCTKTNFIPKNRIFFDLNAPPLINN